MARIHKRTDEERFWSKVEKTDSCWLWQASTRQNGYGQFRLDNKMVSAHRYIFTLLGEQIPDGMQVDHTCHVKRCVNPDHLRFVTHKQNLENQSGAHRDSKSGIRGVCWHKHTNKWIVQVTHNGTVHYGGIYENIKDAEQAAITLRNALYTHNDADRVAPVIHINVKTGKKKVLKLKVDLDLKQAA